MGKGRFGFSSGARAKTSRAAQGTLARATRTVKLKTWALPGAQPRAHPGDTFSLRALVTALRFRDTHPWAGGSSTCIPACQPSWPITCTLHWCTPTHPHFSSGPATQSVWPSCTLLTTSIDGGASTHPSAGGSGGPEAQPGWPAAPRSVAPPTPPDRPSAPRALRRGRAHQEVHA